jgi:hypothetical protein
VQPKMWPKAVNQCWKSRLEKRVNMEPITGGARQRTYYSLVLFDRTTVGVTPVKKSSRG